MKNLILLLLLFLSLQWTQAQTIVYEDFEGGTQDIAWDGINGTYNGVVANPAPDAINSSSFVGSYSNNDTFDFNFVLGTLTAPVDLSTLNLIKMKVWSPIAPSQVLFKFEGGGNAVEMFRDITIANAWVEYSFDLSSGAPFTTMDKVLVSFNPFHFDSHETFYFDDITGQRAIETYETFEGGLALPWQALNGTFNGPVPNPDSNSVNGTDNVGQYVKDTFEYSLLLADRGTPFDLSILNQFHLQIHAQAPTQVLLKLEGPGGPAIEKIKNIGLVNDWQDYTFDFSAAAAWTHLTKVILFFDPGVKTSVDTYYFDNLLALPLGVCKGVTLDPTMIDDFECNRNATYVNGWDSLKVVNNPEPNTVNNSAKVGNYADPQSEQWATLLIDYQNPMDLSVRNQLKAKIWAPREVPILFKLEGGSSSAKEIWVNVTKPGEWVQYEVDFGDQSLANHRKIAIFFNGGQDPLPGDTYYIDDIQWGERATVVIEDFEGGAFLPWEPLDQQALLHGIFSVEANPNPSDPNTSPTVGKYTKGTSAFSTLAAVAPGFIDISTRPQYNLDVYAQGPGSVIMQLESVSQGNKEVERTIDAGGVWQTVSFDFTIHQAITDWASLRLIFNPGTVEAGAMFFFDNLTQGMATVDPCEGTIPVSNLIDDFECQRNYEYGSGASLITVVGNPLVSPANSSSYVGLYLDQPNQPWAALCFNFPDGIDLSAFNQLSLQILSEAAVPILLKLEGGTSPGKEIWTAVTKPGEWETLSVDFSDQVGADHKSVCIFFNAGVKTGEVDEYYVDNIQFAHAPFTGCLINFDDAAFISENWKFFPKSDGGGFELVENPDQSGINTSLKVGKAIEKAIPEIDGGATWQGMYTNLPAEIQFGNDKLVKMKVWSPHVTTITMKIESSLVPPPPGSGDVKMPNTVANEWEEITWDFSPTPITDDGYYDRVTLIFDPDNIPTEDVIYYFDDVSLTGGECATVSSNGPGRPGDLIVSPNPVTNNLFIQELGKVSRLDIYNLYGQRIASVWAGNASSTFVNVSNLYQGTYILTGYSSKGELLALSRFVKL